MNDDLMKETFRNSLTDDTKSSKSSKANADCDKVKVNKSDTYDSNGKRSDSSSLGEPTKKKQKRPREDKSGDGSSLPASVSITPISSVATSLSNSGLFTRPIENVMD